jgi:hypothetical protein
MDAVRREFEVPARSTIRAEIIVLPAAPPGPEQASTLRAAVGQQAPGQQPPSEIHTRRTLRLRRAGWGLLGAAAVGLIVGGSAHFVRQARAVDYNDDARCFYGDETRAAAPIEAPCKRRRLSPSPATPWRPRPWPPARRCC